jgi:predicted metalloprotease
MGPLLAGGGGIGALLIAGVVFLLGGDPSAVLNQGAQTPGADQPGYSRESEAGRFTIAITTSTEEVWTQIFQESGGTYQRPSVEVFRGATQTACGGGQAAMGPFYCPADQNVYLDLAFFDELSTKFGAPGDFAAAYVIAHEVGHHVQNLTGANREANRQGARGESSGSVRLELQADCYAGVWAARANARNQAQNGRPLLETGDVEEGLRAANAIGDDTLQRQSGGRVAPDSFTHGSSAQRVRWFRVGLESGDPAACDTFNARQL